MLTSSYGLFVSHLATITDFKQDLIIHCLCYVTMLHAEGTNVCMFQWRSSAWSSSGEPWKLCTAPVKVRRHCPEGTIGSVLMVFAAQP